MASDTPVATDTPIATNTPVATDTPVPTDTSAPANPPLPGPLFPDHNKLPTDTPIATNTKTNTPTTTDTQVPDYKLNLSHIKCVDGQVEIHFVLLNVPDGITPGTLTYTYGTIPPGSHTGNVWHYVDDKPDGTYDVTSASVVVNGVTVTLHNPDAYAGTYSCSPTATLTFTPSRTRTSTSTSTATSTRTATATFTSTSTSTATSTITMTPTGPSATPTRTATGPTVTSTPTYTSTATFTPTATSTSTDTPTSTGTSTPTDTSTSTATSTFTPTATATPTPTATAEPPRIVSSYCYSLVLTEFMVKIVNSGPAGFVGYSTDGGVTITSVSIGAGSTLTILIPSTATSLLLYTKANSVDDWGAPVASFGLDKTKGCEEDPIVVVFTCSGDSGTPSAWQVVNKNDYDVSFTWAIVGGPDSVGAIDLPAHGTYSFETAYFPGEMQIYVNGVLQAHAFAKKCNPPRSLALLQLEEFCAVNPGSFNVWRVINPNTVALNFEWNILGSALSGVGNVMGKSYVDVITPVQGTRDTFVLYRGGVLQTSGLSATNCARTVTLVPGPSPTPSATVPVSVTPPVLIPVTGVDQGGSGIPLSHIFFNLSLGFLGLGLVLSALSRGEKVGQ